MKTERPPILYGAAILSILSLAWSAYAIADLMHSGRFGLSVAIAGDVGWITVLWAEYKGITLGGRNWTATAAGWAIALGVAVLLVFHGNEVGGRAQAIAGPFVVLVGKVVWMFALEAMKDPTAPTPEQRAELHAVMRDTTHAAGMLHARADGEIAGIQAEARTTLARDEADFQIHLERVRKAAEINRRTPIALPPVQAEQAAGVIDEQGEHGPIAPSTPANSPAEQIANNAATSPNADREQPSIADLAREQPSIADLAREQPSIADLAREQIANTTSNAAATDAVMALRPDANRDSVAAAVRRERRKNEGPYL
ncbi:hypothetical protein [Streptomyces sp. NPDC059759]|uniref:hypothetical protein n=1 Tax=Streptomyces sp. NPDC059759 TaxID=3346936 RepID=UPI00364CDD80